MTDAISSANGQRLAIGIVIYRPEASLLRRLQLALDGAVEVYLFDNSPDDSATRDFMRSRQHAHYSTCGKNVGLGVGISAVCSQAWYDGFPALIFFDQDTVFDSSTLEFVAAFFVRHQDMVRTHSAVLFNAKSGTAAAGAAPPLRDVVMAISSGTMFFLANLKKMNWHDPSYFVDCADYEFCLNSERHGLKIAECSWTPGFDHSSEQPDKVYRLFGRDHAIRRYAASRVRSTLWASLRLVGIALRVGHFRFAMTMLRSVGIYALFQLIPRLVGLARPEPQDRR
jgi:rhamnosyltransferase